MMIFKQYNNVTKIVIPNGVQLTNNNFYNVFNNMRILQNVTLPNNVTNLAAGFVNCRNLTGKPWCGEKVTNMSFTYSGCYNLTGSPACGENVINMYATYNTSASYYQTAENQNGYGGMVYYSSSTCGYPTAGSGVGVSTGCTNDYKTSDIK